MKRAAPSSIPQPSKGKNGSIRACDLGSRPRAAIKRRGSGARRRTRGLGERLTHIRELVDELPISEPAYGYKAVKIRPGLDAWCIPEDCGGGAAALGSSIRVNSQNRSRPGLSGISDYGRKFLKDSLLLAEDFRSSLAMWTVTLPDGDYEFMASADPVIWPRFQRRCIDLVCRYLRENGVDAFAVQAVEIGDKRARRTGRPMPHLHVVVKGWGEKRQGKYLLRPDRMDDLVAKAAQYAGLPRTDRPSCSQIDGIRKSVHNYLSKYLTKQVGVSDVDLSEGWQSLIPRQWWNASEEARALVDGCLFKLSPAFAAFIVQKQIELERAELGRCWAVRVGQRQSMTRGLVGVELTKFKFFETEDLLTAIEWYCLWCADANVVISAAPPMSN